VHRPVAVATIFVCLVTPLFGTVYGQSCPPPSPPSITLLNPEICTGALDNASAPAGFASYTWSATHGSIVSSDANGAVTFTADGSGDVALSVTVTDGSGCPSTGSTTVSLRTIPPPALHSPTANNSDTSKKVGTSSPTFTTPKLAKGTYYYYVVVTSSCGTARSAIATVTAN
jgi:hypothetical protein